MNASMYLDMITNHKGEHEKNDGMFRVRRYYFWPYEGPCEDPDDEYNEPPKDEFYDDLEMAKLDYMVYVTQQIAETKLMEYVELSVYNEFTGFYETQFASHQMHTMVSYGLNPND